MFIVGGVYALMRYVPADVKKQALGEIGAANFFQNTLPRFLRAKLSIAESPAKKREKLMKELAAAIGGIESEITAVAPPGTAAGSGAKPATEKEIGQRLSKTQELVEQSRAVLIELEKSNQNRGVFQKTAERILDKILPPAASTPDAEVCKQEPNK